MRLMSHAAVGGNVDAMVEFAIAQFNGEGVPKNEAAAAELFLKAARRGNPVAQDRLARVLMAGRGMASNRIEAIKWHLIAKAGGDSDPELDAFVAKQSPQDRAEAEKKARLWLSTARVAPLAPRPSASPPPPPAPAAPAPPPPWPAAPSPKQ
jgi:uncharacterized protein